MSEQLTEKIIRSRLVSGQARFGDNTIKFLLSIIDEQRGTIAMHEANADEAALKAARREAKVAELETKFVAYQKEVFKMIEESEDEEERFEIEFRNLRAQVAAARASGHPVNLFEELAWQLTTAHKADVVGKMKTVEVE